VAYQFSKEDQFCLHFGINVPHRNGLVVDEEREPNKGYTLFVQKSLAFLTQFIVRAFSSLAVKIAGVAKLNADVGN